MNCETDFVAKTEDYRNFCKDVSVHIVGMNPLFVSREKVDSDFLAKEKEIYRAQMENENKPADIIDRIVDGKINKYLQETCLMEQAFIKDPDKTVEDLLKEMMAKTGENVQISRFMRFQLGESTDSEE